ncbi:hypothetical protein BB559_004472 [Furculomyces boomerangus]|uniref:ATP synthase F(0) complex subunit e, mitochondrial n=2 Tax=Harpellales TaxID=61421 RepID=A0A2T9Y8F6_9FUNG|nr:hypothetical protein BB559_005463 [Furculomyces boomerangus]PVU90720.1 hypothetical protein BB559_004472 [Furculomyces boomerangus]PWA00033.1 hypothetical protein BB558_003923 [Smittium angustum]PWA02543.1 hypothetical protein BB558_001334 [Smittium angustum]
MSPPAAAVRQVSSFYLISRYSVLGFGIVYGLYHSRTLKAKAEYKKAMEKYDEKLHLIEQAKLAWAKKEAKPESVSSGSVNFEDPNFDAEAWFKTLA